MKTDSDATKETQKHFDAMSHAYYGIVDKLPCDAGYYHREELSFIVGSLSSLAGGKLRILDAGCGPGRHTVELARRGNELWAVDCSLSMLRQTEAAVRDAEVSSLVRRIQADVRALPFSDNSFDAIVCCEVLEHLPGYLQDFHAALKEFARCLKDGGRLFVEVPLKGHGGMVQLHEDFPISWDKLSREEWRIYEQTALKTQNLFATQTISSGLESCGFGIEDVRYIRVLPAGLIEKYPLLEFFDHLLELDSRARLLAREAIWSTRRLRETAEKRPEVELALTEDERPLAAQEVLGEILLCLLEDLTAPGQIKDGARDVLARSRPGTLSRAERIAEDIVMLDFREARTSALRQELARLRVELAEEQQARQKLETEILAREAAFKALESQCAVQQTRIEEMQWGREKFFKTIREQGEQLNLIAAQLKGVSHQPSVYPAAQEHGPPTLELFVGYQDLVQRIREIVRIAVPEGATVIVVSKGDDELVKLEGAIGRHFPQGTDGSYAGHYPADSGAAINHLEMLRPEEPTFLLFPNTAFWWFDEYREFYQYLEDTYSRLLSDESCVIFDLSEAAPERAGRDATTESESAPEDGPFLALPAEGLEHEPAFAQPTTYDVICFPIIEWNFRFQRPQQLMTQFSRAGHRVFYLHTAFHQSGQAPIVREIAENTYELQLPGPASINLHSHAIDTRTLEALMHALSKFRRRAVITEAVCVLNLPFWSPLAFAAREEWGWKLIYDCMDEHSGFATNGPEMLGQEESLMARSDLVVATSQLLYEKALRHAQHVLLLPNAADFEHFRAPHELLPLRDLSGPVIGYYGAISHWFDLEMIREAAKSRPTWQFVLIGHTFGAKVNGLKHLRNVHLLGEQSYDALPGYLHRFDVACIPFLLTSLTEATNPIKFYEYLCAGKPVVAVELPELVPFRDYFYPVRSPADFIPQVEAALTEITAEKSQARIDLARQNTWADRYKVFAGVIKSLYKKAAIVIVGHSDLVRLQQCLERLWSETLYPNFEVIVVDDGTRPEVGAYLEDYAAFESRLKVVRNAQYVGFARAANIGIEAAGSCDYVVILNSEVVITRGWLSRMVRYVGDPRIGLVGVLPDRVACAAAGRGSLGGTATRAGFTSARRFYDVAGLPMYCVGMRRALLEQTGLFDERTECETLSAEDFSERVRSAWYRIICAQDLL